jgi:hypothetical protein
MTPDDIGQLNEGVPVDVKVLPKAVEVPEPGTVIPPTPGLTVENVPNNNLTKGTPSMIQKYIIGNEKAIIGGLSAGILTLVSQIGVNGQMTIKEAAYSVASWVVTHVLVYITTNTP